MLMGDSEISSALIDAVYQQIDDWKGAIGWVTKDKSQMIQWYVYVYVHVYAAVSLLQQLSVGYMDCEVCIVL
jgi:hypothetical protein